MPNTYFKLWRLLGIMPGEEKPSAEFIRAVVDMRNHKQPEEIAEIEKACDVTSDMHIAATKAIRPECTNMKWRQS